MTDGVGRETCDESGAAALERDVTDAFARTALTRGKTRLSCVDFGGHGPPVLLLHGLAGHALEWTDTARRLGPGYRVLALEARGHGRSERLPGDVSLDAHVADVAFVVQRLELVPVVLIGHSMGGVIALLVAAKHPELVRGLVVADAGPPRPDDARLNVEKLRRSLERWPVPFASREQAIAFFGGPSLAAEAWAAGLEPRHDGWWPSFEIDVMTQTLADALRRSYWEEWQRIRAPTLAVRAEHGMIQEATAAEMARRLLQARVVTIAGAGHDLHLERPAEWGAALEEFLSSLAPDRRGARDQPANPDPGPRTAPAPSSSRR